MGLASSNPGYRVTLARRSDISSIAGVELAAAELLAGYAPDWVVKETTSEQDLQNAQIEGRLWVALAWDMVVGFAHVTIIEAGVAHLEEIDVHPDQGRRGLGTRLVAEVCRWAEESGYPEVTLTTFREVQWNMPFYARLGFEEIPAEIISPVLRAVLRDEASRGLDPARRVAMKWRADSRCNRLERRVYVREGPRREEQKPATCIKE